MERDYILEAELRAAVSQDVDIQEVRFAERINLDNEPVLDVTVYVPQSTDLRNMPFTLLDKVIATVQRYFSQRSPGKYPMVSFGKFA